MLDAETFRERMTEWLPARLGGAKDLTVFDVKPPSGNGYSSETALFAARFTLDGRTEERRYVTRLKPTRDGVFPTYDIELQFEIMDALADTEVPVPEMLWREDDTAVLGSSFFVMAHVDGRVPSDNPCHTIEGWVHDAPPEAQRTLHTSALETMALIHGLDWKDHVGFLDGRVPHGLAEYFDYYERFFSWAAGDRPQPVTERAWDWLQANKPTGWQPVGLSWGDSRISNMIFGDDNRPVAVIDWEMASLGDPEMDLGWWLFLDRHFSEGLGVPNLPGFLSREETVRIWEERTGRPAENVEFYEVFAGFRFAVVMIRLARMLIDDGILPTGDPMEYDNIPTQCLTRMLDKI
jgi:aminoglycoside phosphotransferase (APT) family kinase protein